MEDTARSMSSSALSSLDDPEKEQEEYNDSSNDNNDDDDHYDNGRSGRTGHRGGQEEVGESDRADQSSMMILRLDRSHMIEDCGGGNVVARDNRVASAAAGEDRDGTSNNSNSNSTNNSGDIEDEQCHPPLYDVEACACCSCQNIRFGRHDGDGDHLHCCTIVDKSLCLNNGGGDANRMALQRWNSAVGEEEKEEEQEDRLGEEDREEMPMLSQEESVDDDNFYDVEEGNVGMCLSGFVSSEDEDDEEGDDDDDQDEDELYSGDSLTQEGDPDEASAGAGPSIPTVSGDVVAERVPADAASLSMPFVDLSQVAHATATPIGGAGSIGNRGRFYSSDSTAASSCCSGTDSCAVAMVQHHVNAGCPAVAYTRPEFLYARVIKPSQDCKVGLFLRTEETATGEMGIFVTHVSPEGLFARSNLRPGDRILLVNGKSCIDISTKERTKTEKIIKKKKKSVTVKRVVKWIRDAEESVAIVARNKGGDPYTVSTCVQKPTPSSKVQVTLKSSRGSVAFARVDPKGLFGETLLDAGHRCLMINGIPCNNMFMKSQQVADIIASSPDFVTIVSRPRSDNIIVVLPSSSKSKKKKSSSESKAIVTKSKAGSIHKKLFRNIAIGFGLAAGALGAMNPSAASPPVVRTA